MENWKKLANTYKDKIKEFEDLRDSWQNLESAVDNITFAQNKDRNVGGDTTSKKVIYVAWTIDDGPTLSKQEFGVKKINRKIKEKKIETTESPKNLGITEHFYQFFKGNNIDKITWFIVETRVKDYDSLKNKQDAGNEIGIHTTGIKEGVWIPGKNLTFGETCDYPNLKASLAALDAFEKKLTSKGIKIKFYRPPFGLLTEIEDALRLNKYTATDIKAMARAIIFYGEAGNATTKANYQKYIDKKPYEGKTDEEKNNVKAVKAVRADFNILTKWQQDNGNFIGIGGTVLTDRGIRRFTKEAAPKVQDWNFISDQTTPVLPKGMDFSKMNKEKIEKEIKPHLLKNFATDCELIAKDDASAIKHYVILTHDTNESYFNAMQENFIYMEQIALAKGVKILYQTMTEMTDIL